MYETVRREVYWRHMAAVVERIVREGQSCGQNNQKNLQKRKSQLLLVARSLDFIPMDIIRPFYKKTKHNQKTLSHEALLQMNTRDPYIQNYVYAYRKPFFDHWLVPYGIPSYFFTDNSLQLTSSCFATLCTFFPMKLLTTTVYHWQTSAQAERYHN